MAFTKIQIRRDTAANWASVNPILDSGEQGFETDTGRMKIGNGAANWASLAYFAGSGGAGGGSVTQVSGTAPVTVTNGTTTPSISIQSNPAFTGIVTATGFAGAITTPAQTNITSVGSLTGLTVGSGTANLVGATSVLLGEVSQLSITGGTNGQVLTTNGTGGLSFTTPTGTGGGISSITGTTNQITVGGTATVPILSISSNPTLPGTTTGTFSGSGAALTNINGANVTGTVPQATSAVTAATVTNSAQLNITSVGSLTGLTVGSGTANLAGATSVLLGEAAQLNITGGTSGQVLTSNGATGGVSFTTIPATLAGGPTNSIQFNGTSNAFTGSAGLTFNTTGNVLTVGTSASGTVTAGNFLGNGATLSNVATLTATIPTTTTTAGNIGQFAFDVANNLMYVCIGVNEWRRTTLSTFGSGEVTSPEITTTSIPSATIGTAYVINVNPLENFAASGSTPITWSWAGNPTLPPGLTMDATTGQIIGTPTGSAASYTVNVTATGPVGASPLTDVRSFTFSTVAALPGAPVVNTSALQTALDAATGWAAVNEPFSFQLTATNSPTSWTLAARTLPAGLNLSTTGLISGTPSGPAEDIEFSVTATNAGGTSALANLTLRLKTLEVDTSQELNDAVDFLNAAVRVNKTITVLSSIQTNRTQNITASGVTIVSDNDNPNTTRITGDGMTSTAVIKDIFNVSGANFTIRNMGIGNCGGSALNFTNTADSPTIEDCIVTNTYDTPIDVGVQADGGIPANAITNGRVSRSVIGWDGVAAPAGLIRGLIIWNGTGWIVESNRFQNVWNTGSRIALRFWSGSNFIARENKFINCGVSIYVGGNNPGGVANSVNGGSIENNYIYSDATVNNTSNLADIMVDHSPNVRTVFNTILDEGSTGVSIEYRYDSGGGSILNNLTNKAIVTNQVTGGTVTETTNYEEAQASWFTNKTIFPDLDKTNAAVITNVSARGTTVAGITTAYGHMFDATKVRPLPVNTNPDIGAYEFDTNPVTPTAPTITTDINDLPIPTVGTQFGGAGGFQMAGTGSGTLVWSFSGSLPSGMSMNSDGLITGTPLQTSPATGSVTFTLSNGVAPAATLTWNWTVTGTGVAPTITTPSPIPVQATVGQNYEYTLSATGTTPITWTATVVPDGTPVLISAPTISVWRAA
jgi:hypothetical protein